MILKSTSVLTAQTVDNTLFLLYLVLYFSLSAGKKVILLTFKKSLQEDHNIKAILMFLCRQHLRKYFQGDRSWHFKDTSAPVDVMVRQDNSLLQHFT